MEKWTDYSMVFYYKGISYYDKHIDSRIDLAAVSITIINIFFFSC